MATLIFRHLIATQCDRVLPACNHCSWAVGRECKYTPLPTPAHRGIPRCDRCRLKNLKVSEHIHIDQFDLFKITATQCDRNLPVCNHCAEEEELECNYTPKKRHKVPSDNGPIKDSQAGPYGTKTASFLVSDVLNAEDQDDSVNGNDDYADQRHSFYGQNIAATSSRFTRKPVYYDREGSSEPDVPRFQTSSQITPDHQGRPWIAHSPLPPIAPKPPPLMNQISFITHTFPADQGMVVTKSHIEPWSHPAYPPLPEVILRSLNDVNLVEMPDRNVFAESLAVFLAELAPELRETAAFMPDTYTTIHRCVASGELDKLSDRLRVWLSCHNICSGSNKQYLLLIPRDEFFQVSSKEKERLRAAYVSRTDGKAGYADRNPPHSHDGALAQRDVDSLDIAQVFERIPVQPQIYDILVYAHRSHISSSSMLFEIRRLGIVCSLC
jgi:hypothetical protein